MPLRWISNGAGRRLLIHDTAGLRRRSRISEKLEKLSVADTINAIRFADVVIVLIDAQTPFEEQGPPTSPIWSSGKGALSSSGSTNGIW